MVVKYYEKISYGYEKESCGYKKLKNIVIKDSIKVYSIHIIKQ